MRSDILQHGDVIGIIDALNRCAKEYKFEVNYIGNGIWGFFGIEEWMHKPEQKKYWGNCFFPWKEWKNFNELNYLWVQEKPGGIYYKWRKLKRRNTMNSIIIEMFPVTKEAVLVDKWFGREIDKPIFKMLISGKEKELLKEAERLQKEENNKK